MTCPQHSAMKHYINFTYKFQFKIKINRNEMCMLCEHILDSRQALKCNSQEGHLDHLSRTAVIGSKRMPNYFTMDIWGEKK